jgi:TolB protein
MMVAALLIPSAAGIVHGVAQENRGSSCRLYHPAFDVAGTKIVAASDCEAPWGIYVMQADGTQPRRVTPRQMEARLPNWSPDGSRIVFQSNQAGNWEIYTVRADGSGLRRLTEHPGGDSSPSFSPDGRLILFTSDREGRNELYLMPADGGVAKQITRNKGVGFRTVWAPDGTHILYRASTPPTEDMSELGEFHRVRPDGTDAGTVTGGKRREYNQAYSRDGARIAFDAHEDGVTWETGTSWDVWVMNADGSGRRNLTAGNGLNDWAPSWSPDGKTIIFLSGTNNIYDIFLMNADGSLRRRLTTWTDLGRGPARARRGDEMFRGAISASRTR